MTANLSNLGGVVAAEERQVEQQLNDVEARLMAHYGRHSGITAQRVRATVEREAARFEHARVRTFVPILVERAVRHDLDG
ncbi:MAG TPA: hypothetical protein VNP03_24050 [Pseudonocardia sp.]|nr:hypothetical protein [Pseudonocardia sp.]